MGLDLKVNAIFFDLTQEQINEVVRLVEDKCAGIYNIVKLNGFDADKTKLAHGQRSNLMLKFGAAEPILRAAKYKAELICAQVTKETGYTHNIMPKPVGGW